MADFDFRGANAEQRQAIETTEGPVLILAGPGTGKTFTLVQRAVYLIQEKRVAPEEIILATFTKKAANELYTRISEELFQRDICCNLHDMYIGTIHSICLRLLRENLEESPLRKNFLSLDETRRQQFLYHNAADLYLVPDNCNDSGIWKNAGYAGNDIGRLMEELVTPQELMHADRDMQALGTLLGRYRELLRNHNVVDYSSQLLELHEMLKTNSDLRRRLQAQFRYIMIDEYQDTNCIQEDILLMLAGPGGNICVVGDDDQSLYAFRGATVHNILNFPQKFEGDTCKIIKLRENYRSPQSIVDFYSYWMSEEYAAELDWQWGDRRYDKQLHANRPEQEGRSVVAVRGQGNHQLWCEELYELVEQLRRNETITDYNQIAFLFYSIRSNEVQALMEFFEGKGINVYSPRSDMFFQRDEVKLALGCLWMAFEEAANAIKFYDRDLKSYYRSNWRHTQAFLEDPNYAELAALIRETIPQWVGADTPVSCRFSTVLYRLLSVEPFRTWANQDLSGSVTETRQKRNLARLIGFVRDYETSYGLEQLTSENLAEHMKRLFVQYLSALQEHVVHEHEDFAEYAPSGCLSFLTIHQAKGMEFPVVVVGLPDYTSRPRPQHVPTNRAVRAFGKGYRQEENADEHYCEFWRLYYVAFSRAQDLLVLTSRGGANSPNKWQAELFGQLPDWRETAEQMASMRFCAIKTPHFKPVFTYNEHIRDYDSCPRFYEFHRELNINPWDYLHTIRPVVVQQTLEDINRAVIKEGMSLEEISQNTERWMTENYATLNLATNKEMSTEEIQEAREQVSQYCAFVSSNWERLSDLEKRVSLIRNEYVLNGKVDLVLDSAEGHGVELMEFCLGRRPSWGLKDKQAVSRQRQMLLYARLMEERYKRQVDKLHLYYVGSVSEEADLEFVPQRVDMDDVLDDVDETSQRIVAKDFNHRDCHGRHCHFCALQWFCGREGL